MLGSTAPYCSLVSSSGDVCLLLELQEAGLGIQDLLDSYATLFDLSKQLKLFANLMWCLDQQQTIVSFMSSVASMFNSTIEFVVMRDLYVVLTYDPDELWQAPLQP